MIFRASVVAVVCAVAALPVFAADVMFDGLMDTKTIGASDFISKNPAYDGRGVVIAVLDTGVDMGVEGLRQTSQGKPKVIAARDFTREGLVECRVARKVESDGETLWRTDNGFVRKFAAVSKAGSRQYLGFLDEKRYKNSSVTDLNGNGRSDDQFAVVVFQTEDGKWKAAVDLKGDGDMSDAAVLASYEDSYSSAKFKGYDPAKSISPLTVAINLDLSADEQPGDVVKVDFHLATAAHGTHVAGIAAGWHLAGKSDFNGIAPGAQILSLKIGDSRLSGGATVNESMKKALEFAARWGREHNTPVVVNASYGIGSEVEGNSDIDKFVDKFVVENPHVVIVTSAGNLGPGLSTVGTPAAANGVLAVAAVFSPMNSADILGGVPLGKPAVFNFSARGGELAKPDVAAPGIAASTVPFWARGDIMSGTSMASPQVAGAAALMLSAMVATKPAAEWNSGMVYRAIRASAKPLAGYTALDYGAGMADVSGAWKIFESSLGKKNAVALQTMAVETDVPTLRGRKGGALFWRAAGWVPSREDTSKVKIRPVFSSGVDGESRASWYQRFVVSADRPWVGILKKTAVVKGEGEVLLDTWIDRKAVATPGIHVANIKGVSDSGIEFRFPVTVVTPYPADKINGVPTIRLRNVDVPRAGTVRIPFQAPAGTSWTEIYVRASEGAKGLARAYTFDGSGHLIVTASGPVNSTEGLEVKGFFGRGEILDNGTCELVLAGLPVEGGRLDVDVRFNLLDVPPVTGFSNEAGKTPETFIDVVNNMDDVFAGSVEGSIQGFEKAREVMVRGDLFQEGFSAGPEFEKVEIELEMQPDDYNRFTDIAVNIVDRDGKSVASDGFSTRRMTISVPVSDAKGQVDYRIEVRPGRAVSGGGDVRMMMKTRFIRKDKVQLFGTVDGGRLVKLYPAVRSKVRIEAATTPASLPSGAVWYGFIQFKDRRDGAVRITVPVRAGLR
jgi:subtilisin family serine protease